MITIGFSTREVDEKYINHLKNTIGVKDVEIIPFVNKGTHSLTEVYNEILKKSKYDIVVLCHDDIRFKTKKWGDKILNHFSNSEYGILGVAGTYNLHESGMWWKHNHDMVGIVNHVNENDGKEFVSNYSASVGDNIISVVCLDGVFLALHKQKIKYSFDTNIKGFHFYDVDFTFGNYINGVKVGVITNIRITHLSVGRVNKEWEKNRIDFSEKWKTDLPSTIDETQVFYETFIPKIKSTPKVSIIILSKSANKLLFDCIDSFIKISKYPNYEIIVGDTGSSIDEINEFKVKYKEFDNIRMVEFDYYNFSKNNNEIVKNHLSDDTQLILFCNNDIKLLTDVITHMVHYYNNNKHTVGTMGARLHFENGRVQHSGIILFNHKGNLNISHYGINTKYTYMVSDKVVFGNTAALMMVNKNLFTQVGMFNETYSECFEDVELNNTILSKNKKNILVSNAVAYHYESQTRKKSDSKLERERKDMTMVKPKIINNKNSHKFILNL